MPVIRHRTVRVTDVNIFVREAGDPADPALVLLHGFPSSSRHYVRLLDRLAGRWHVVAPDYPGFGLSDPLTGSPTFDRLAEIIAGVIDELGIDTYALYLFDFGAPVGFRVALRHDLRVRAVISQNANAYTDGFGPGLTALAGWWADPMAGQPTVDAFVRLEGTKTQWLAGARDPEHIDPSQYLADQAVLDLPGRAQYMKDLLWDYQFTVPRYEDFHTWLRDRAPGVLAIWGRHDPFFTPAGAHAYRGDVPDAEVVLLDTGHFALEEEADTIATAVDAFLTTRLGHASRHDHAPDAASITQEASMNSAHAHDSAPTHSALADSPPADGTPAVRAVLAFYAALGDEDLPAALARLGEAVTWHEAPGMPYAGTEPYRGAQQVAEHVLARITSDIDGLTLTNHRVVGLGTTVAVLGTYTGTAHRARRPLVLPYLHVWTVVGDAITEFRQYTDTAAYRAVLS